MLTNSDLTEIVFSFLSAAKAKTIVVCAGARNAPLVMALKNQQFNVFSFFEERSAAFFALGLIKAHQEPVAIITTSGTAVAELLPATIEAFYQGLPLILISADRPKSYRGTGSPQSIEQFGIFTSYVETAFDFDKNQSSFEFKWTRARPIHLNICFDEPLLDAPSGMAPKLNFNFGEPSCKSISKEVTLRRPLLIIGELTHSQRKFVSECLAKLENPFYLESLSQLKGMLSSSLNEIKSSDALLEKYIKDGLCDSIVRVGGVPTLRFWRDLEGKYKDLPVVNYTDSGFTGLSRKCETYSVFDLEFLKLETFAALTEFRKLDLDIGKTKNELLQKFPNSEPAFVRQLSKVVAEDPIYLGNSLPIRNWDQFANSSSNSLNANRGANGIDGQISTYLGWSQNFDKSYCLVGDLTTLYDLAALGLTDQLHSSKRRIVIMNNLGGRIFQRVFKNEEFINSHQRHFDHWAAMWGWDYIQISESKDFEKIENSKTENLVIELLPNNQESADFWAAWDQVCRSV